MSTIVNIIAIVIGIGLLMALNALLNDDGRKFEANMLKENEGYNNFGKWF